MSKKSTLKKQIRLIQVARNNCVKVFAIVENPAYREGIQLATQYLTHTQFELEYSLTTLHDQDRRHSKKERI